MLLTRVGGFWLLPPQDFPHHLHNESHPMDHDSVSSGHTKMQRSDPDLLGTPLHPAKNAGLRDVVQVFGKRFHQGHLEEARRFWMDDEGAARGEEDADLILHSP
jgi:hypothetical protein